MLKAIFFDMDETLCATSQADTHSQRSAFSHLRRSRNSRLRWWAVCTGVKGIRKVCMLAWRMRDGFSSFDFSIAWHSTYASAIAAIVTVIVAIPVAHAALTGKVGKVMERVTYFGFGIPGIVMGTALVRSVAIFRFSFLRLKVRNHVFRFNR